MMEMESLLPKPTYGSVKRYMRRRRYQRIDGAAGGRKKMNTITLRGGPVLRRRRYWRIKAIPRMTWVAIRSPIKMLTKLKNAYMNFMLKTMTIDNHFGDKRIPKAREVSKDYTRDVFEARLIFEISKALVASNELYSM